MPLIAFTAAAIAICGSLMYSSGTEAAAPPVVKGLAVRSFAHDHTAFTQGLVFHNGNLLEGTGHYGESRLRVVDLQTGRPLSELRLSAKIFGEGITVLQDRIYQLTWREGFLIEYDAATMTQLRTISYRQIDDSLREGWGIAHDGTFLIISDGSAKLRFVDPTTWKLHHSITVRNGRSMVRQLNELEYVNGEILANVWYSDSIARIDPKTGNVVAWIDLSAIRPPEVQGRRNREAVLNGIAWDAAGQRLFVTGKNWPRLFQVEYPPTR